MVPGQTVPVEQLRNIATNLSDKYYETWDLGDLDNAIAAAGKTLSSASLDHQEINTFSYELSSLLGERYLRTGDLTNLESSLQLAEVAVAKACSDDPKRPVFLNNNGHRLAHRYELMNSTADLEEAIRLTEEAVRTAPPDHPERVVFMNNLAARLNDRHWLTGSSDDLERAIQIAHEVAEETPRDHPSRPKRLSNLGALLGERFSQSGTATDLEEALHFCEQAVRETDPIHPALPGRLNVLSIRQIDKYWITGNPEHLVQAVNSAQKAVDKCSADSPDRALFLTNLASVLSDKHMSSGKFADLEDAILVAEGAVEAAPPGHGDRPDALNILGSLMGDRYLRRGALIDLDDSIRAIQEAVDAVPGGHLDRPRFLSNMCIRLGARYIRTGRQDSLDKAIECATEVVRETPLGHPGRPMALICLASLLGDRCKRDETMAGLEEAIRMAQEAVDTTPIDYPDQARYLDHLAWLLGLKYFQTGNGEILNQAIEASQSAMDAASSSDDRAGHLSTLGFLLGERHTKLGAPTDLADAIARFEEGLNEPRSRAISRITAGRGVIRACATNADWKRAYDAAHTAIHLVPLLTSRSLEHSDKEHALGQIFGLASDAVAAAFLSNKGPLAALRLLELGRGVLATSLEEMRAEASELRRDHPGLFEKFTDLRDELTASLRRNELVSDARNKLAAQWQGSRRYHADQELEKLVAEIRKLPNFDRFLLSPAEGELMSAARRGPVVVVNLSQYRCDAVLVEFHQIRQLPLPDLRVEAIKEKVRGSNLGSSDVLEWLWDVAAGPILDALGFTKPPVNNCWPHIWWMPTGALAKFPFHAAGYHTQESTCSVMDRAVSSYSPSIKALILARQRRVRIASAGGKAVLAAMPTTPGHSRLPFAADEVMMLLSLCSSMGLEPVEPGRCKNDLLTHLPRCNIFHFAGHGRTDPTDPLRSQLILEDWETDRLTVSSLLDLNLREKPPFLAFLSACGTGQVKDDKLLDESIHLISACQLAGFRHVIGTLWEVSDKACVDISRITYETIRDRGFTDDSVSYGLHQAARSLRSRWVESMALARSVQQQTTTGGNEQLLIGEMLSMKIRDGDVRNQRDITLCDDDDENVPFWVPYVHFGV
jgi:tetratricopeptide (TPR) repeat protein